MAIDTKYSYWEIFYNPDIPLKERVLWAAASPIVAPLVLLTGCTSEEPIAHSEYKKSVCFPPHKVPKESEWPHEKIYSDGNNYVIADTKIKADAAKLYLDQIPPTTQAILNFFGIDSPYENNLEVRLLDLEYHPKACLPGAMCAGPGRATFPYNDPTIINTNASQNKLTGTGIFYHEFSHALRNLVAEPWWGLEEGLAVYTERHLAKETDAKSPTGVSQIIYSQSVQTGQPIEFPQENYKGLLNVTIRISKEKQIWIEYTGVYGGQEGSDKVPITNHIFISSGDYTDMYNYLARVDIQDDQHVLLKLYDLPEELKNGSTIMTSVRGRAKICKPEGIKYTTQIMTTDGLVGVNDSLEPYNTLRSFDRDGTQFDYYDTGFCFWETLREQYGHDAVKTMVQSMLEFSKQQPVSMCPAVLPRFPFFNTFKDTTGMTDAQAKEYFARFSAPIDDFWYISGSVNWPKK